MAVERYDLRFVTFEVEPENPGVCRIHQPQPNPFSGPDDEGLRHPAVHGHRITDPPVVAEVVEIIERLGARVVE